MQQNNDHPQYKPLTDTLARNGHIYKIVARTGHVAIYQQFTKCGKPRAFEVVIIRRHDGFSLWGKVCPPAEIYPTSRMWGRYGWTLTDLPSAEKKMAQLIQIAHDVDFVGQDEMQDIIEDIDGSSSDVLPEDSSASAVGSKS